MGNLVSFFREGFPPQSKFTAADVPDLNGKVVIVTGGNTGIGYQTVKVLLEHNATVYLLARSQSKGEAAVKKLEEETDGKKAILVICDLADIASVRECAAEIRKRETELHILFNSGGVMTPPLASLTANGYDLQFGTNVLGHAILTILLLPLLLAGAKSSPDKKARVINTSSYSAYMANGKLELDVMLPGTEGSELWKKREKEGRLNLYHRSKFGDVVFSNELARRYGDQGIMSAAVNPGNLETELARHYSPFQQRMARFLMHPVHLGALTQLYAGTSPETVNDNGKWFIPWARRQSWQPKGAENEKLGKELWEWVEEQMKAHP